MPVSSLLSRLPFWPWGSSEPPGLVDDDTPEVVDGWIKIYTGHALLARPEMAYYVKEIERRFAGAPEQLFEIVSMPLRQVAALVQLLPASENYHHYELGGLLRHQLDCMAMAASAGFQIHQLADPQFRRDNLSPDLRFWTRYCFQLRALTHDLGKIHSMFDIRLRIETANGELVEEPYRATEAGFGAISLAARADRELCKGARSVRYRYRFSRTGGIHDHEKYWQIGIAHLIADMVYPVPACFVDRHLTDSPAFFEFFKPKLDEIDQRSVVKDQSQGARPASHAHHVCQRLLIDLSVDPSMGRAELVCGEDNLQRLFLPFSVIQDFLNGMPETYLNESVPRHPDQIFKLLKASGLTEAPMYSAANRRFFNEYNGRAGVFLSPDTTAKMCGLEFLRSVPDNVSAPLSDIYKRYRHLTPVAGTDQVCGVPDPSSEESDKPENHSTSRTKASLQPLGLAHSPKGSGEHQDNRSAARAALLGTNPRQPPFSEDDPPSGVSSTSRSHDEVTAPPTPASRGASRKGRTPGTGRTQHPKSASKEPLPVSLVEAVSQHLETITKNALAGSQSFSILGGELVFSKNFVVQILRAVGSTHEIPSDDFLRFSRAFAQDKWRYEEGRIICTPAYSSRLCELLGLSDQLAQPGSDPLTPQAGLFDTLGELESEQPIEPSSDLGPLDAASSTPDTTETAGSIINRSHLYSEELRGLMDTVRSVHINGGENWLEFDGRSVRLDFRALDAHTGDRQKRGRMLEMLRALGLYLRHTKSVAVFITPDHPEVRSCLADLQQNKY